MKYILLASASAFAFAGAAMADVSFGGSAELGYNDNAYGDNDGFYWSANIGVSLTQELNNGLEAGASVNFDIADMNSGMDLSSADYVVWLTSENAGLYFGITDTAAAKHWSGVSGMEADNFTSDPNDAMVDIGYGGSYVAATTLLDHDIMVLRGDISYGNIDASVSYLVPNDDGPVGYVRDLEQLSVGASGSFGNFNFAFAYQDSIPDHPAGHMVNDGDFSNDRVFGLSVGTTFGGADVTLAYARNDGGWVMDGAADVYYAAFDSVGVQVSYPVGPVTLGAYYVAQEVNAISDGNTYGITADYASGAIGVSVAYEKAEAADADWSIEASYDVGNGLTVYAGTVSAGDANYIGGEFDMGNGATLGLSFADDTAHGEDDEIGAREYQEGTTAWVSFTF